MAWRLAKSLETLRNEVNAAYPRRNKLSDGTIGDPRHAAGASRHNPNNANVVCAIDITHDPAGGCDIHALARRLVLQPHSNLEYVISNGEVAKRRTGFAWEPYTRENKHIKHAHFAVGRGSDGEPTIPYDDIDPWGVGAPLEEDDMAGEGEEILQRVKEIQQTQEKQNAKLQELEAKLAALAATNA